MNFLSRNLNFLNFRRWYPVKSCELYERDLWYPGPSTIGPVAKKQPPTTISSTDGTGAILIKYLKTLYGNLIEL